MKLHWTILELRAEARAYGFPRAFQTPVAKWSRGELLRLAAVVECHLSPFYKMVSEALRSAAEQVE